MKYRKIVGLLATSLLVAGTAGVSSALAACPNMPRVEQVNFKNNESVVVDHQKNSAHGELETAKGIKEFEGNDSIEWKSPKAGEVKKNWPLAYVRGTEMTIEEARLAVEPAAQKFLETEVEEPPKPTLTGETTIKGVKITFTREFTIAEIKKQLGEHKEYLVTGEIKPSKVLPNEAFYESIKIKWKWTLKEKGGATIEPGAGESTHNLYVTYEKALAGTEIPLTLLDLDTQGVEKEAQPPTETSVLAGVWKGFANVEGGVPSVHIRAYNPATGAFVNRSGTVLWYWEEGTSNMTLGKKALEEVVEPEELEGVCASPAVAALLEELKGTCDQWAKTYKEALAIEGVKSEVLQLRVKFAGEENVCEIGMECAMLVKNWTFGAGTGGEFPYAPSETTHGVGVPGQGVKNPPPAFYNHYIVKAGPKGSASLYDPSYGTGPFSGGAKATEKSVLEEFQTKSIDGFCRPKKAKELQAFPSACQSTPTKLQLQALKENGTEGFEFP